MLIFRTTVDVVDGCDYGDGSCSLALFLSLILVLSLVSPMLFARCLAGESRQGCSSSDVGVYSLHFKLKLGNGTPFARPKAPWGFQSRTSLETAAPEVSRHRDLQNAARGLVRAVRGQLMQKEPARIKGTCWNKGGQLGHEEPARKRTTW